MGKNTGVFPSAGDLPVPGIKLRFLTLQADSLPSEPHQGMILKMSLKMAKMLLKSLDNNISKNMRVDQILFLH